MNLWRFKIRTLGLTISDRVVSTFYVTLTASSEKDAVRELTMSKHSPGWWTDHIILEIEGLGELWWDQALHQLKGEYSK